MKQHNIISSKDGFDLKVEFRESFEFKEIKLNFDNIQIKNLFQEYGTVK